MRCLLLFRIEGFFLHSFSSCVFLSFTPSCKFEPFAFAFAIKPFVCHKQRPLLFFFFFSSVLLVGMASSSTATQNQAQPENAFDQLAPSSASALTNKLPWDIFINHRGTDVKHTLAATIYHTFDRMGLRVFLDVEALDPGDVIPAEIQQAMTSASLHIAIFSRNYAQSPWCLAELSFMLKTGKKIIPIFYHVQPSDIRWIQGKSIYADAFSEYEKKDRYKREKLEEWKKALYDISFHSGYVVTENKDEGELLKNIVNCALRAMKNVPLEVAKHPVGLDELVEDFEGATLQSAQSHQNVKIVGIVGMGGVGKTTLAKELFNKKCSSFDGCSFVFEVRDGAYKNALHQKQKKLLEDLCVSHLSFDNVEDGKGILSNRLRRLRALIVLDDVDHIDQLDALLPNINSLASDSLVIITSRELGALMSWGISCNYHMPKMNWSHAERLFCWHAFLQPSPPAGFESLVEKFVMACNRLPLSLKVLGGQLYGRKTKDYWESQLDKISRILPSDIRQRLQISYDALDEEEKEVFLDVACFFIGKPKSLAIAVWDASGWSGLYSWETLLNKCLVELYEDMDEKDIKEDCIWMHDHLRDMGRQIAYKHSPYRLKNADQILHIPKNFQERILVRGIADSIHDFVPFKKHILQLKGKSRKRSKRPRSSLGLKILHVESNQFTEEFSSLSEDLVWLCWYDFQERNLPSWLSLRNLRVLELRNTNQLEELWEDNGEPPLQLRELRITCMSPSFQRFQSSIGHLKHLKKIIFTYYGFSGSSLPEEFCGLQSLEHLMLPRSEMLSSLPAGLGDLINMQHIDLSFCRQLMVLPDSFKQLICLKHLNLSFCEMLTSLPAGFGDLINLQHIDLRYCRGLKMLPDSFKQLIHLEYFNLEMCSKLKFRSDMLENISKLEYFNLRHCEELEELPHQIINQKSLRELDLIGCINLRDVPINIGTLCKLETLKIGSPLLTSLPSSLGNLSSLTTLQIWCSMLTSLPTSIGNLSSLTTLEIWHSLLTSWPTSIGNLSSLTTLNIWSSEKLECLPYSLGHLNLLRKVTLCDSGIRELPFRMGSSSFSQASETSTSEECCPNLQALSVLYIPQLMEIGTLPTSLNDLQVEDCYMLKNIGGIGCLVNLEILKIINCPELDELPNFSNLASLKKIVMQGCPKIEKIEGLEHLRSLQFLKAQTRVGIQGLENVERLKVLRFTCDRISTLKPCIQSIKECPLVMELQGRAVHFAKPIVNSSEFPDLTVMELEKESDVKKITEHLGNKTSFLYYVEEEQNNDAEGKVVHIAVYTKDSHNVPYSFFAKTCDRNGNFKYGPAIVVGGEKARVVLAFYQLLALLD